MGASGILIACSGNLWFIAGDLSLNSFGFAFQLHFVLIFATANLDRRFKPRLDSARFNLGTKGLKSCRQVGVITFMRLLQVIGWTRALRDKFVLDGTRATLASYEKPPAMATTAAHGCSLSYSGQSLGQRLYPFGKECCGGALGTSSSISTPASYNTPKEPDSSAAWNDLERTTVLPKSVLA